MPISEDNFGSDKVKRWTLTNSTGTAVQIIDYGATITSFRVPARDGEIVDIVLGYDDIKYAYLWTMMLVLDVIIYREWEGLLDRRHDDLYGELKKNDPYDTRFIFYKNPVYKNVEAQKCPFFKNIAQRQKKGYHQAYMLPATFGAPNPWRYAWR